MGWSEEESESIGSGSGLGSASAGAVEGWGGGGGGSLVDGGSGWVAVKFVNENLLKLEKQALLTCHCVLWPLGHAWIRSGGAFGESRRCDDAKFLFFNGEMVGPRGRYRRC